MQELTQAGVASGSTPGVRPVSLAASMRSLAEIALHRHRHARRVEARFFVCAPARSL
jgi:hypothetical protein